MSSSRSVEPKPPALRYSVQDRSILLPAYKRFLVTPTLPIIPAKVDPNAITHFGHLLNLLGLGLLAVFGGGFGSKMDRGWVFFAAAALVQLYLWCDNADGGHARRTNQCSATGEFLDHGLDLLNATYVACMTVLVFGAPPFWSFAAAVAVPAAAAVTYWEQAETGVFQLGLFNQIESIFGLTLVLCLRGVFGSAVLDVHVLGVPLGVLVLGVVSAAALGGIAHSAVRVARKRGRMLPFVAPVSFGVAVTCAAAAIVAGATVFVFLGIRRLTQRVRGERPLAERGVLVAAALVFALALWHLKSGVDTTTSGWLAAIVVAPFGWLAAVRAREGHRAVSRLDAR